MLNCFEYIFFYAIINLTKKQKAFNFNKGDIIL